MEQQNSSYEPVKEVDLREVLRMIKNGIHSIFRAFLRLFIYLKKNFLILLLLGVVGLGIGYGLSKVVNEKKKIQVIVKPNIESRPYLYDVIEEIQANVEAEDAEFFRQLGIEIESFDGLGVQIESLGELDGTEEERMEFLQLLLNFENSGSIGDLVRQEILNSGSLSHKVTFFFKFSPDKGREFASAVLNYINNNQYYNEVLKTQREISANKMAMGDSLTTQVDQIISGYATRLQEGAPLPGTVRTDADGEEAGLDIGGLLEFKYRLINNKEQERLKLVMEQQPISVLNFGQTQQVIQPFYGDVITLLPILLIVGYLLFDLFRYLNRRAKELNLD